MIWPNSSTDWTWRLLRVIATSAHEASAHRWIIRIIKVPLDSALPLRVPSRACVLKSHLSRHSTHTPSRPQRLGQCNQVGQNIAPWSTLNASISPSKPSPATSATVRAKSGDHDVPTLRLSHKHTLTPAPATDPPLVFRALRPVTRKIPKAGRTVHPAHAPSDDDEDPNDADD